jgi:phage gp16-like protein
MSAYDEMGKVELRAACKEAGITGYGKMTVAAMREALSHEAEQTPVRAPVVTTPAKAAPKADPKAKRESQEERNGVKRPRAGGLCAQVWEYLDQHGNMMPKDLKQAAAEKGWNENNASIELYGWRKFNGLGRLQAQPKAK